MKDQIFRLQIEDGKFKDTYGLKLFKEGIKNLSGCDVKVTLGKWVKKRSLNQNAFYFYIFLQAEIDCFKERFGETYSREQMHEFNKTKFWGEEKLIEATGEIITMPGSSATQSTVEFEGKLENARQWFRQNMDWEVPYPNEQAELAY